MAEKSSRCLPLCPLLGRDSEQRCLAFRRIIVAIPAGKPALLEARECCRSTGVRMGRLKSLDHRFCLALYDLRAGPPKARKLELELLLRRRIGRVPGGGIDGLADRQLLAAMNRPIDNPLFPSDFLVVSA